MSWEERLFSVLDDLEHQAEALYDAERAADLVDRSRSEYAAVTLASRLAASVGREIGLDVRGVGRLTGTLRRVASGWCLVSAAGPEWVVSLTAVDVVVDPSERSLPEVAWPAVARLGIGSVLRRLADAAEPVVLHLTAGGRHEVVPERVGRDFVEARATDGRCLLVAFDALAALRSGG